MSGRELAKKALDRLLAEGAKKAECRLALREKKELNIEQGKLTLLRTTCETSLHLGAIVGSRKGTTTVNKLEEEALNEACRQVVDLARSSEADPAYDIAEKQPPEEFRSGPERAELDLMYERTGEFLRYARSTYPKTTLRQAVLSFNSSELFHLNSAGVDFVTRRGLYSFEVLFSSRDGQQSSSFNYSGFLAKELDRPLKDYATIDTLLRQSTEQVRTRPVPAKFVGDIIVTPDCLADLLESITDLLKDHALISGTSVFKDKLAQQIADSRFTLRAQPLCRELAANYFVTADGYKAGDCTVIDRGTLRSFLLSLYGSRKTGKGRAANDGGCYLIDPGQKPLAEIIGGVQRGILLCRFSGGNPSSNGDFSGVAKNSYFLQDGKIRYPISETMIYGNLVSLLLKVLDISKERANFGHSILPWIRFGQVTVSGKE